MQLMTLARSFLFLLMTDFPLAAGSFSWTLPPPAWTPTDGDDVRTVNFTVLDGSTNVALRWNYTLGSNETLALTQWKMGETNVGFLTTAATATVFDNRFVISTSEIATLIIKNVADIDDATFECQVTTSEDVWKYKISVEITVETSLTSYTGDQTVNEGADLSLFCNATGKPTPNIIWTRVWKNGTDGEQVFHENPWVIVNINRTSTGAYRCTADNGIGNSVNHSLYVNVTYKPDIVTIVTNTTENKDCSDLWVNFTCNSSEANPPVYNYLLSDDEDGFSFSKSGTWIKKISRGGKSIYSCTAYQLVGNVTSTNNITLTVNVPLAVGQTENKTVHEGDNAELYCNMSGFPDPTVIWTKVYDGGYSEEGKLLNITNITRAQAGKYKCNANNTCGEKSTVAYVDVQYKPENVRLTTNTTSKVCKGVVINFTCTAEANPAVHTYLLYENDTVIQNMGISGTWTNSMENASQFVYRCTANNSIQGIQTSDDAVLTVEVPIAVGQTENKTVHEGDNAELYCNMSGFPDPTVIWTKVHDGGYSEEGKLLNITNITRAQAGKYKCNANNTCGKESAVAYIDVQYPPVDLRKDYTIDVLEGHSTKINCEVHGNPPPNITWYKGNDTSGTMINTNGTLMFTETVFNDSGWYTCLAQNFLGNISVTIYLRVGKPSTPITTSEPMTEATKLGIIIGASAGGAIVLVVIVVVAWCVHHKRKCRRKGSKVRCSESEEQAFTPREDNDHGHINNGYAEAGPRPTAMVDISQHQGASVAPTYAVVDKSAKKGSMKDKKDEEKKPQTEPPQYSVVDKSKKKKKKKEEEPEATYAQVDMSKKSKKKAKPGEVLYADLGDFYQMQELPNVSTSPKALPPIKKPAPYVETQYADITQFLKGDVTLPDSEKSQGPATDTQPAPLPENQEGQEPGTSAKETSQASNPGGDGGPDHETNF